MSTYPKTALVINCGSSSVKFAILDPKDGHVFLNGIAEALGLADARISWKFNGGEKTETQLGAGADHSKALEFLVKNVLAKDEALHDSIVACGHRIVQGGDIYSQPTLIDDEVEENIKKVIPFAPLHNPAHLLGIDAARANFPSIPHVAVFDTAFHQTMPEESFIYPVPYEWYTDLKVRKYGAHGTSHQYVMKRTAELMGRDYHDMNMITCHLGNGASITAIKNGEVYNTSMGLSPLGGIMMGSRCGDIDPTVVYYVEEKLGLSPEEMDVQLNKKSGMLGISGISSDSRDVEQGVKDGNPRAVLTSKLYAQRVIDFIGSYYMELGHVDAIAFTAGLGEHAVEMRERVLKRLEEGMGVKIDYELNSKTHSEAKISTDDSKVQVWVVPTNEELVIARDTVRLLGL